MRMIVSGLALLVGVTTGLHAVPSFARQTGLAYYQCHVTFGAPVPDFTWTGKKFRITGYRYPWAGQKFEAGTEGAVSGNRLVIPIIPYLAFRFQSTFASQNRPPGATSWSNVQSNPTSRFSFFPGGPVGEHFSLWAELYATPDGSATNQWSLGTFSFDEFDFRFTQLIPNGIVGLAFTTQSAREIGGFGPWPVGLTDFLTNGGYRGWAHPNRGMLAAYGWFGDRLFAAVGAGPGEDNFDWGTRLYTAQAAYALANSDEQEIWVLSMNQFGDDGIPITTQTTPSRDGRQVWVYSDMYDGLSDLRPGAASGNAYVASDVDNYIRSVNEVRYGFVNRGPHSLRLDGRLSLNHENYIDGADITDNAVGIAARYTFQHTWGLDVVLDHTFDLTYTDPGGLDHEISGPDVNYTAWLTWRPAANVLFGLQYSNTPMYMIAGATGGGATPPGSSGRSWTLGVDFLF